MNFLGIPVADLDPDRLLVWGKTLYGLAYLGWVYALYRGGRLRGALLPLGLALVPWVLATYPLERLYGLESGLDRQRNVWWCATAAAGNPPWESGVVGRKNLEPAWALFVASLSLFDPARVMDLYPFLPALAIVLVGLSFHRAFRSSDGTEPGSRAEVLALLVVFFLLLAPTGPLDVLGPYRGFWQRMFLLKPNHALGLAFLPLVVSGLVAGKSRWRLLGAALALGALGWAFVVHWALTCLGLGFYGVALWWRKHERWRSEVLRLAVVLAVALVIVAPYLYYLVGNFPVVSFPEAAFPEAPGRSVWGDSRPTTHSLFFLATFDLGPLFFLASIGIAACWARARRFELLWVSLALGGIAGWAANVVLLFIGQARQSDEIYFFLLVMVSVLAAFGLEAIIERIGGSRMSVTALAVLLWFPLTLPWWWDPIRMDAHVRLALDPLPSEMTRLGEWLREHSNGTDVVLAGTDSAMWIPALSGRRVLRTGKPEPGTDELENELRILFPGSPEAAKETLERLGVRFVVVDPALRAEHGLRPGELDRHQGLEHVFEGDGLEIYRARD